MSSTQKESLALFEMWHNRGYGQKKGQTAAPFDSLGKIILLIPDDEERKKTKVG